MFKDVTALPGALWLLGRGEQAWSVGSQLLGRRDVS